MLPPLATRLRPKSLEEFFGQAHLLEPQRALREALEHNQLHSMIFWGPPGTGKTTLARLFAQQTNAYFVTLSAVQAGVKEIRQIVDKALELKQTTQQITILFIDEIHRFNKAQQDIFLPYVEDATLILIGATTENPSFSLNNALLSRVRVYVLKTLEEDSLLKIIERALTDSTDGLGALSIDFPLELQKKFIACMDGDARLMLNTLEIMIQIAQTKNEKTITILEKTLQQVLNGPLHRFDKFGDYFYDLISALHKSVRGSDPDASLYWFCCMLERGCHPLYIARRLLRIASEDIGNADPRALTLAREAYEVYERIGSPEGELALAQAVIYLAVAPKSNAVYTAYTAAVQDAKQYGTLDVPLHLRNAPTSLMKSLNYGKEYRYAHDESDAFAAGEHYFPKKLQDRQYYFPVPRGLEIKISEKLAELRKKNKLAREH